MDALVTMHGIYYVDIINWQVNDHFMKQMNLQETFYTINIMYQKASNDVEIWTCFAEKGGDEAVDHKMDL